MIHTFLKSIGFSELYQNKELYQLVGDIIRNPDERAMDQDTCGNEIACFTKYVENDMGICVCGSLLEENQFQMEYYFPFFRGSGITTMEPVEIERHASSESFFGICDELKMGIPLIFFVNNVADVFREYRHNRQCSLSNNTVLSALACNGKILLPIMKTKEMAALKRKSSKKKDGPDDAGQGRRQVSYGKSYAERYGSLLERVTARYERRYFKYCRK